MTRKKKEEKKKTTLILLTYIFFQKVEQSLHIYNSYYKTNERLASDDIFKSLNKLLLKLR